VQVGGTTIGSGAFRTWPQTATRLTFLVIGDYGTGQRPQYEIAKAMVREFESRARSESPVRFVLTTGDNIYGDVVGFGFRHSGADDSDWADKFFMPYSPLLASIPFYPTLGNHDGNETERRADLSAYLDNFFFPGGAPSRYYRFEYGGLAEFFALDSTKNSESGSARPAYARGGEQYAWMERVFKESRMAWKIPYYHHPMFNAGPRHGASRNDLEHWLELFAASGVKVVFNGHEHNFQISSTAPPASGIRFVTTGAGGELRHGDVRERMAQQQIAGWTAQNHFLVVEIDGKVMRITPIGFEKIVVRGPDGNPVGMPVEVRIP
jgi:hypothetical protein